MPSSPKLRVFIVDDHYLILQGLSLLLVDEPGIVVVGSSSKPAEVADLLEQTPADVLLTDISMPGMSGIELTAAVLRRFPHMRALALSMFNESKIVHEMIEAGISGYVLKDTSKAELVAALTAVGEGKHYFSSQINTEEDTSSPFTIRELEILRLIVKEYNNKQIAEKLFISERTVETHRRNILRKTDAVNTVGLVRYAYENKLI